MSFISSAVFWGIIIVLFGLSIILKEIFHVNFPFLRVIFGIILIFWGLRVISGSSWRNTKENTVMFHSADMNYDESKKEYNIIFGRGNIDLFKSDIPEKRKKIEVNVIFGNGNLILNDSIPARIKMNSVFGNVRSERESVGGFGSSSFTTSAYKDNEPCFEIESNAVFGNLNIENRKW